MKIRLILFLCCCGIAIQLTAQKFDYNWLTGYNGAGNTDTAEGHYLGFTRFDFNSNPVQITRQTFGLNFSASNSTISDSSGQLLFYCNGVSIYNYADQLVENGDSLGWGYFLSDLTDDYFYGQAICQFHIALPSPKYKGQYDVFYSFNDSINTANGLDIADKKLLRATLDMNANNGLGRVTRKDSVIINHEINGGAVTATKHANGYYWWIVTARTNSNCLDVLLYDGSDTIKSTIQCLGDSVFHGEITSLRFSPDGSKFILASSNGAINIYDFDRCSGIMNLRESFIDTQIRDSTYWAPCQIEISPNSRFAYVCCREWIFQFDLDATSVQNSKTIIATYSGFTGPFAQRYDLAQLAPDGKIYIATLNANWYYGVINNPDEQGAACNFTDHSLEVTTFVIGMPTYCNWRLGPLYGSGCDTLTGISTVNQQEQILKIFPNPANDVATIDYGFTDWGKGAVNVEITNALGQIIYTQQLPMYSGFQKINVSQFAAGTYTVFIKRANAVVATNKVVVVH